jgi:leucyl/phenylalanyl-tRNA---protein transferase
MSIGYYALPTGDVAAIDDGCDFPPLENALTEPNGLLAIGGTLNSTRLLNAYRHGIFPWFSQGEPVLWWSPDPRMVLFPEELKISTSLKKVAKQRRFTLSLNTAFRHVITACSAAPRPGQSGTWLTPDMIEAYCTLHAQGFAVSSEAWQDGRLVGGCYGIQIGRMFYGESMFHHVSNASKLAFMHLVQTLQHGHVGLIDCQMHTHLLASFGAREIPRAEFMQHLTRLINLPSV